jgi:c(7)-type cytochrome triheme protein
VLGLLLTVGCAQAAQILLDLPPRAEKPPETVEVSAGSGTGLVAEVEEAPPPIESVVRPGSVLALLPRDRAGNVDWVAAESEGVIRPRAVLPGEDEGQVAQFPFDFFMQSGDGPEASFPHSTHADQITCETCHPGIYRRGDADVSGDVIHGEASCGRCHGPVAFPIQTCERCHEAPDLPSDRVRPDLGTDYVLSRTIAVSADSAGAQGQPGAAALGGNLYPPSRFPHWSHRIRYKCKTCHDALFEPLGGSTNLTEDEAHGGSGCGACHDAVTAFDAGLEQCHRCHITVSSES